MALWRKKNAAGAPLPSRHCRRCGGEGPFRDKRSWYCTGCEEPRQREVKARDHRYYRARSSAARRMRETYPEVWAKYLDEELRKERQQQD